MAEQLFVVVPSLDGRDGSMWLTSGWIITSPVLTPRRIATWCRPPPWPCSVGSVSLIHGSAILQSIDAKEAVRTPAHEADLAAWPWP